MFIYFIIFQLLFSQNDVIENTTEIIYKTNNQGIIGFDSTKGHFIFPKSEPNNFIFGLGLITSGINSETSTTFSSFSFWVWALTQACFRPCLSRHPRRQCHQKQNRCLCRAPRL